MTTKAMVGCRVPGKKSILDEANQILKPNAKHPTADQTLNEQSISHVRDITEEKVRYQEITYAPSEVKRLVLESIEQFREDYPELPIELDE